jgi:hypothetical protein
MQNVNFFSSTDGIKFKLFSLEKKKLKADLEWGTNNLAKLK